MPQDSKVGFTMVTSLGWAYSDKYIAVPTPRGTAIINKCNLNGCEEKAIHAKRQIRANGFHRFKKNSPSAPP